MKKVLGTLCLVVALVGVLLFLSTRGITFVVRNVGPEPLHSIIVHVTGNSYRLGEIPSGESRSVMVRASSESHIELEQATGKRLVVDCYFEGGYKGTFTADVTANEVVRVKDSIRLGPI